MNLIKRKAEYPVKRTVRKYRPAWSLADDLLGSMFDFNSPIFDLVPRNYGYTAPRLNMTDEGDRYVIEADVPGYGEENLSISIDGRQMTIRGDYKTEEENNDGKYLIQEKSYSNFVRTINLPQEADTDNVEAELKRGILHLYLPKHKEAKAPKAVKIVNKD